MSEIGISKQNNYSQNEATQKQLNFTYHLTVVSIQL
jgi:hypothetical protein